LEDIIDVEFDLMQEIKKSNLQSLIKDLDIKKVEEIEEVT